jgi:hypothetical protein
MKLLGNPELKAVDGEPPRIPTGKVRLTVLGMQSRKQSNGLRNLRRDFPAQGRKTYFTACLRKPQTAISKSSTMPIADDTLHYPGLIASVHFLVMAVSIIPGCRC